MKEVDQKLLKRKLDDLLHKYYHSDFISEDPISIPHRFSLSQDIEIAAFFAAMLSWGNRKSIIHNANLLMALMDNAPYQFIVQHEEKDLKKFENFKHRTFQFTDLLGFLAVMKRNYSSSNSMEDWFLGNQPFQSVKTCLIQFHRMFFNDENIIQNRSKKHLSTPDKNSACKRLNMFLRWMVRDDGQGVDFGIWKKIPVKDLMIPLDVHVHKTSLQLGLMGRTQADWRAVEELTTTLRKFDRQDPVKYDYALFCLGLEKQLF